MNFSVSLNFLSNSLRSFLSSPMLLLGIGQNLRPSLSWFIWSLFNLCEDKFIIFGLMLLSFFISFFSSCWFFLKNGFCLYFLNNINFCLYFLNRGLSCCRFQGDFYYIQMGLFCFVWSCMCCS